MFTIDDSEVTKHYVSSIVFKHHIMCPVLPLFPPLADRLCYTRMCQCKLMVSRGYSHPLPSPSHTLVTPICYKILHNPSQKYGVTNHVLRCQCLVLKTDF